MATELPTLSAFNERSWLNWLVKARVIVITLLLGIELALTNFTRTSVPQAVFVSVIVVWYTVAAFFMLLRHLSDDVWLQSRVQILTDLAFVTAVIYVTGGIDTSFNFLYPLVIIVAAMLLPRYWAYLTAALSFILFGGILELSFFEIIRSYSVTKSDLSSLQAVILINLGAYLAIAYLASILSAKLRQVRAELQEQSGALEHLQALHEDIVNSVTGGLITTDLNGLITYINPAAERVLERESKQLLGTAVEELISDRVPEIGPCGIRFEAHTTAPSGSRKTIGLTVSPLNVPMRGTVGYIYSFNDLTEVRRLQQEVRMRDRMAVIGRLAAGIAHEIRNPLSSIAGCAKMLRESAALDEDERKLMDVVKRESERLNGIVTDFLTYSREKEYSFAEIDLLPLLEDTLTLLQNRPELAAADGNPALVRIERRFEVASAHAWVDGNRIKQVFWNICDNAVRAMPSGGTLTVSLRTADGKCIIEFEDSGIGIPPQRIDKIFEPFQSEFQGGTGLGLALVYQIIQGHEGKITVQSTLGVGTVFSIELRQSPAERKHGSPGVWTLADERGSVRVDAGQSELAVAGTTPAGRNSR
ncbi:MAG TPA: ATP-binding protein [Terriglobales bacterium]|nr:ATP-binding protein [Terriglobales bacterium]